MLRFPAGLLRAVEAFEHSIAADDGFASAYAGLSVSYTLAAYYMASLPLPPPQILPRAKDLAERALALDDSLAEAHLASGLMKMAYEWDWAGAKAALERALALTQRNVDADHLWDVPELDRGSHRRRGDLRAPDVGARPVVRRPEYEAGSAPLLCARVR